MSNPLNSKHLYVALDADVLRALATVAPYYMRGIHYDYERSNDPIVRNCAGYLFKLLERSVATTDELRLLVTTSVFYEVRHKREVVNFINDYCYIPKQNNLLDQEYMVKKQKIKDLAYAYCGAGKPYDPYNPPPMDMKYMAEIGSYCPTNDCYIMAEATVENAILVTNNRKDFIYNKNIPDDESSRLMGIISTNAQFGYVDESGYSPRPIALHSFGPLLRASTDELRFILAEDSTKLRANAINK